MKSIAQECHIRKRFVGYFLNCSSAHQDSSIVQLGNKLNTTLVELYNLVPAIKQVADTNILIAREIGNNCPPLYGEKKKRLGSYATDVVQKLQSVLKSAEVQSLQYQAQFTQAVASDSRKRIASYANGFSDDSTSEMRREGVEEAEQTGEHFMNVEHSCSSITEQSVEHNNSLEMPSKLEADVELSQYVSSAGSPEFPSELSSQEINICALITSQKSTC